MRLFRTAFRLSVASALLAAPAVASAQNSTGVDVSATGVDNSWSVAYKAASNPLYGPTGAAIVIDPSITPPWVANSPGSYQWIGVNSTGTVDPNSPGNGDPLFDYLFSTTFHLASASTLTFTCAMDNSLGTLSVNSGAPASGGCGVFVFGAPQSLTLGAGWNSLTFHVQGDGKTDGLVVHMQSVVTPEPASLTLLATGLVGIYGAARRRRQSRTD